MPFEDKHNALALVRSHKPSRRRSEPVRFSRGMLDSIDDHIRELARTLVHSDDPFDSSMAKLEIDAWQQRRQMVQAWCENKQEAESDLYESFLRYHRGLLPDGKAIDLLAEAEGVHPDQLRSEYATFRQFLKNHGDRLPAAHRVLAAERRSRAVEEEHQLRDHLKEAERRARETLG